MPKVYLTVEDRQTAKIINLIKAYTRDAGKRQKDMAPVIGLKPSAYSTKLTKGNLTVWELLRLCNYLQIPAEDLTQTLVR